MTKPEIWLWSRLKIAGEGVVFRRQHAIGPYVLDFYCVKAKLCVEVDGVEHRFDQRRIIDQKRDEWLAEQGIFTVRVPAVDVLQNLDETAETIIERARSRL